MQTIKDSLSYINNIPSTVNEKEQLGYRKTRMKSQRVVNLDIPSNSTQWDLVFLL